jgi:ArsR family metal-binding transcriptional regulator
MLIETYRIEVEVSTHSSMEFEYEAIAHLPVDISPALPYLNAALKNGSYFPDVPAFSWRQGNHKIGFWPDRIAVDHIESRERANEMIEELVGMVNDIWDRRGEIQPVTTTRENLQPLELYRLLPKTHCKECGESTCFNFALKLAAGQVELSLCRPLCDDPRFREQLDHIKSLLIRKRPLL